MSTPHTSSTPTAKATQNTRYRSTAQTVHSTNAASTNSRSHLLDPRGSPLNIHTRQRHQLHHCHLSRTIHPAPAPTSNRHGGQQRSRHHGEQRHLLRQEVQTLLNGCQLRQRTNRHRKDRSEKNLQKTQQRGSPHEAPTLSSIHHTYDRQGNRPAQRGTPATDSHKIHKVEIVSSDMMHDMEVARAPTKGLIRQRSDSASEGAKRRKAHALRYITTPQ
jgi:hypothetical protein